MIESIAWGVVLRIIQASLQAAPFIFTGLLVTALLHRLLRQSQTKKLFGSNSVVSLFQSWVIGMLLPGCSLGVIPIVNQLRKSGIAVGTIFAFALSSPLFDPLSLLYGLTLSKPLTIVAFAFCSLFVVTVSGSLFDWLFPNTEVVVEEPVPTPHGIPRLLAILVVMARESVGSSAFYIACGLVGTGLLSVFLPPGCLQRTMAHENSYAPLVMTAVAIPAYATPMTAMGQLSVMFQHGNSIGAAFILLTFGAGMNLGLLVWMISKYGWLKCAIWMSLMLLVVVGISYGIERPLFPTDIEPADHTHAFDTYCQVFVPGQQPTGGFPAEIWRKLKLETQFHEIAGAIVLLWLITFGLGLRYLDQFWVIETWLNQPLASKRPSKWDREIPGPVLAAVGFLLIMATSVAGCFAYYPAPSETLEEMRISNTEVLSAATSRQYEHALHWIPLCESWNHRLQVGMYLRTGRLSEYHRWKSRIYRDRLETLEHMVENRDPPELIRQQVSKTSTAYQRLTRAYREEL